MTQTVVSSFICKAVIALLIVGIVVCNVPESGQGFSIQELSAELTVGQLTTSCSENTYHGAGGCIMNRGGSPTKIRCEIVHNVEDWVDITIRQGFPGVDGTVIYHFVESELFGFFEGEIVRGNFYLTEDDDDTDEIPFLNGEWYIHITSDSCPQGALRGQFTADYNIASLLRGFNEIPPISSPDQGYALGYYNPATKSLETFIEHSMADATNATINLGASSQRGEVLEVYESIVPPITGTLQLDESLEESLYSTGLYFNIDSRNFPNGEIRDQLHVIDAIPQINYVFTLTSNQVVPAIDETNEFGSAIFYVNCDTGFTEYMISHNIPTSIAVNLRFGSRGQSGALVRKLNGIVSPIMGNTTLTGGEYVSLLSGQLYIEVVSEDQTGDFPHIRGQLVNEYNYYAYLSGSQVVPPQTTASKGLALFNYDTSEVNYVIQFDNITPNSLSINSALVGENGNVNIDLSTVTSSENVITGSFGIDGTFEENFTNGGSYVSMNGQIRGQIVSTFEQCAFPPYIPPPPEPTVIISSSESSSDAFIILPNIKIGLIILMNFILFTFYF